MTTHRVLTAIALLLAGVSAQAHEFDPGGRIVVTCASDREPRMAEVGRAVDHSHYWAGRPARQEMLALAQQACANGADEVVFVPPADQRYAASGAAATKR